MRGWKLIGIGDLSDQDEFPGCPECGSYALTKDESTAIWHCDVCGWFDGGGVRPVGDASAARRSQELKPGPPQAKPPSEAELYHLYYRNAKTTEELGDYYGVGTSTVQKWLNRYGFVTTKSPLVKKLIAGERVSEDQYEPGDATRREWGITIESGEYRLPASLESSLRDSRP